MNRDHVAREFADLDQGIFHRFHRRDTSGTYRLAQESHGVVRHICGAGPLTVMEAARHFERSPSAMSERISRLEQRNLLERMSDEQDQG